MTARQEVFRIIHDTLREKYPAPQQRVLFVGIAGTYAAGKTTFSRDMATYLCQADIDAQALETDMYFRLSKPDRFELEKRLREERQLEQRRHEGYVLDTGLWTCHLDMLRQRQEVHQTGLYQRETGEKDLTLDITFNGQEKWILYDGVWVTGEAIREHMDLVLILTADQAMRMERARSRAGRLAHPYVQTPERFHGIDEFTRTFLEQQSTDMVINNTDINNPLVFMRRHD